MLHVVCKICKWSKFLFLFILKCVLFFNIYAFLFALSDAVFWENNQYEYILLDSYWCCGLTH